MGTFASRVWGGLNIMGREAIPVKLIMQASSVELRSEANQTHLAVTARGLELLKPQGS